MNTTPEPSKVWSRDNELWGMLYVFLIAITGPFGAVVMVLQLAWMTRHGDGPQPLTRKQRKEAEYARLDGRAPDTCAARAERASTARPVRERAAKVKADANRERILKRRRANGENV
jgi:hypothetical protein